MVVDAVVDRLTQISDQQCHSFDFLGVIPSHVPVIIALLVGGPYQCQLYNSIYNGTILL